MGNWRMPGGQDNRYAPVRENSSASGGTGDFHLPTVIYGPDGVTPISSSNPMPVKDENLEDKLNDLNGKLDDVIEDDSLLTKPKNFETLHQDLSGYTLAPGSFLSFRLQDDENKHKEFRGVLRRDGEGDMSRIGIEFRWRTGDGGDWAWTDDVPLSTTNNFAKFPENANSPVLAYSDTFHSCRIINNGDEDIILRGHNIIGVL